MGRRHLADAAAAHLAVLVACHIHVAAQQMVGHVVLHRQLEQQSAQPFTEHTQRTLQHPLQCTRQICARPLGVQSPAILPQGLLHKLVADGTIIQLVECIYLLPHIV